MARAAAAALGLALLAEVHAADRQLAVVGLGWPRTGTGSLCEAAEVLGLGPCYHMSLLPREGDVGQTFDRWVAPAAEKSNATRRAQLVVEALAGHTSAAGAPLAVFWKELVSAQALGLLSPRVKFVLPRASAEDWYTSSEVTVWASWRASEGGQVQPAGEYARRLGELVWSRLLGRRAPLRLPEERHVAIAAYEKHMVEVAKAVPADRLVRWSPEDGWGPLCKALGVSEPGPKVAMPWKNKRGAPTVKGKSRPELFWLGVILFFLTLFPPVVGVALLCWLCRERFWLRDGKEDAAVPLDPPAPGKGAKGD